eukprot:2820300-Prorocentrum_lima.AAC.1
MGAPVDIYSTICAPQTHPRPTHPPAEGGHGRGGRGGMGEVGDGRGGRGLYCSVTRDAGGEI